MSRDLLNFARDYYASVFVLRRKPYMSEVKQTLLRGIKPDARMVDSIAKSYHKAYVPLMKRFKWTTLGPAEAQVLRDLQVAIREKTGKMIPKSYIFQVILKMQVVWMKAQLKKKELHNRIENGRTND